MALGLIGQYLNSRVKGFSFTADRNQADASLWDAIDASHRIQEEPANAPATDRPRRFSCGCRENIALGCFNKAIGEVSMPCSKKSSRGSFVLLFIGMESSFSPPVLQLAASLAPAISLLAVLKCFLEELAMKTACQNLVAASFVAMAGLFSIEAAAQQPPQLDFVPGEILIGYKSKQAADKGMKALKALEKSGGVRTRSGSRSSSIKVEALDETSARITLEFKDTRGASVRGTAARKTLEDYAAELRSDPKVDYAHPNWIMRLHGDVIGPPVYFDEKRFRPRATRMSVPVDPNDIFFQRGLHWHYMAPPVGMNATGAWPTNKGSRKVVVAVLDTGILPNHPDLKGSGNLLPGYDFVALPPRYDGDGQLGPDADPTDPGATCPFNGKTTGWHGSHVAGTIGAGITNNGKGIAGVNWSISVLPIRVMGPCGGSMGDIAAAIMWAAGVTFPGIPKNPNRADVINLSLGGLSPCVPKYAGHYIRAIRVAKLLGSTVVVAAGNSRADIKEFTPAGCEDVISVAASDRRGHIAPYSNYGAVTVMAPGGDTKRDDDGDGISDGIWSLVAPSSRHPIGIAAYQGTSMAAPHVAAAIAMAISQKPELRGKPDAIKALLMQSAARRPHGACFQACDNPILKQVCLRPCGAGLLDVKAMIAPAIATSAK